MCEYNKAQSAHLRCLRKRRTTNLRSRASLDGANTVTAYVCIHTLECQAIRVILIYQDPWQLRRIFGDLEEGNLFLIQTAQVANSVG